MRKILSLLIFAIILSGSAMAYSFSMVCSSGQTLYYTISSSTSPYTVRVVSQNSSNPYYSTYPSGNLVIPSSVSYNSRSYSVTGISNNAFYGCSELTSVTIPNSVTYIGDYAFYGCSGLTGELTIPNSVTSIGNGAFRGCQFSEPVYNANYFAFFPEDYATSYAIPEGIQKIAGYAFYSCSGLISITIPETVTSIGQSAFSYCTSLTEVNFNATNCTTMGVVEGSYYTYADYVFYNCNTNATINIGSNVTTIPDNAFRGILGSGDLIIPNSVANIGNSAFYGCSGITSITIPNSVTSIGNYAFYGCSGITSITIPNSVTSIGESAFSNCSGLETITIGNSVESIGDNAFSSCTSLTEVNFNATNCTTMGEGYVFYHCNTNATINIGRNVTTIPDNAFWGILGSGDIIIPNSVANIGNSAFYGCSGITSITIPNSVTSIGSYAFKNCSGLTSVTIPNSVTSIGSYAFYGCSGLETITIGNSVESIGESAFSSCTSLIEVNFNASNCSTMGRSDAPTFRNCNSATTINIGNAVTRIPNCAFYGLLGNGTLTIPNSVTSIGDSAFLSCNGFSEAIIGNSITYISNYAFKDCSGLTSITIGNSLDSIGLAAFYNCTGLTSLIITNSVKSIGNYAFGSCRGLTSVTIGTGVTNIGSSAFSYCGGLTAVYYKGDIAEWCGISFEGVYANPLYYAHNLYINNELVTDLVIPETVTEIKASTFVGATCLTSAGISNSVTSIGSGAFSLCSGLNYVTIGNSVASIGDVAFYYCDRLTEITIPSSVVSIGEHAFSYCNGLVTVNFNARNCTTMGNYDNPVFDHCYSLSTLNIGEIVTNIPDYAFISQYGLTSVTIPNLVTNIGRFAFLNCGNLETISIGNSVTNIGNAAFSCNNLTDIYANPTTPPLQSGYYIFSNYNATLWIPCGLTEIYDTATGWSNFSDIRERLTYTLQLSSTDLQMGTASIVQQPTCYNDAIIEGIPNRGYAFSHWNDGNTDNPRSITVTEDVEYTASFVALPAYTITALSDDEIMGAVVGGGTYYEGEDAILTANPFDGYEFVSWNDGNTDNPRTITVTGDATYTATFVVMYTITVLSSNDTMGIVIGGGVYADGTQVEISATANEHYHFIQWNDDDTENPRTITVTESATYIAQFAIDQHTITVESADDEMGTVSEGGTYDYGSVIQISAIANDGFGFISWNDGSTDNPRSITVTEDATFTANFGTLYTITVHSADTTMGSVIGNGEYIEGTVVQITAVPNVHYHFVQWNDGNTDNPRTITVFEDVTYTAAFAIDQYTIRVISSSESQGTVSGGGTYDYGSEIQISATANNGYEFVQWNDGDTDNPRTITVTHNTTYVASFRLNNSVDEHLASGYFIYPNPTSNIINITSSETISRIEIANTLGQVVYRTEVNADNAVCNVEGLTNGIYVVRIHIIDSANNIVSQIKFVKE